MLTHCRCQTKFKTDSQDPKCSQSLPGYWQLPVKEEDCIKTAFCPGPGMGLYGFCRMPFGVTGGPSSFQRLMDKVLYGLPFATSYIDDVLVHLPNMKCHLQHLRRCLSDWPMLD